MDAISRLEELTAGLDPAGEELAGALMELYGEGLERIMAAVDDDTRARLAEDGVIASLLLMHGLYPVPLEERVREALDSVRPYMESHGGDVELLGVEGGIARLRLEGSCNGCPSSTATLKNAIEDAIQRVAPDIEEIKAEGAVEPSGLLQIEIACPPELRER